MAMCPHEPIKAKQRITILETNVLRRQQNHVAHPYVEDDFGVTMKIIGFIMELRGIIAIVVHNRRSMEYLFENNETMCTQPEGIQHMILEEVTNIN